MRLNPQIKVIAPWREWDLNSRTKLIEYAEKHGIEIATDKRGEAPFSVRCQYAAHIIRRQSVGRPRRGSAGICLSTHG